MKEARVELPKQKAAGLPDGRATVLWIAYSEQVLELAMMCQDGKVKLDKTCAVMAPSDLSMVSVLAV